MIHGILLKLLLTERDLIDKIICEKWGAYMSEKLTKKILAERLKRAIDEKGITQTKLASLTGISVANISNYVCAKSFPPVDVLTEIAKALEKSLDWFCYKAEENRDFMNIETVGDAVRIVEALENLDAVGSTNIRIDFDDGAEYYPVIFLCGGELLKYIEDKNKMRQLLRDGTIDQALFDRWKQDRLSALDHIPAFSSFPELDDDGELSR